MRRSPSPRLTLLGLGLVLLAGCNLVAQLETTPTPIQVTQIVPVTATPPGFSATLPPASAAVTPIPGAQAAPPASTSVVDWLVNFVVVPAWNFIYTFVLQSVSSLWEFAGARGGVFAQGLCCIVPGLVVIAAAIRYVLLRNAD